VNRLKACGVSHFSIPGCMHDFFMDDEEGEVWMVSMYHKGLNKPDWEIIMPSASTLNDPPKPVAALASAFAGLSLFHEDDAQGDAVRARIDAFAREHRDHPERTHVCVPDYTYINVGTNRAHDPSPVPVASASFGTRNVSAAKETPALWHQRLGHTNMRHLEQLVRLNKIKGINVPKTQLRKFCDHRCEICIMAKHARSPFHSKPQRATRPLVALHCDLCGPYPVPTIGGGYFTQTVLDEYASYAGGSILKKKSDGPEELKRLILAWEAETGKKVTTLYTDRGGEFINDHLRDWFLARGIKHIFSTPRTPEENGKAERVNMTINDFVRALLYQYALYLPLWGHAYLYAIMIYNSMLNKRLGMSRQEAFNGTIPDVSNFRTFGCKVYARVPETARNKLSPKSQIGIFLGPESQGPGYKVLTYNPELQRDKYQVRIFRDIVCFEDLKATSGVQESSELHWGGNIPMPRNPEPEAPAPPELESLTGVPEAPLPSATELARILRGQVTKPVGNGPEGYSMNSNLKKPLQMMPALQAMPLLQGHEPSPSCAEPGGGMQTQDLMVESTSGDTHNVENTAPTLAPSSSEEPLPVARPGVQQPSGQVMQEVTPPRTNETIDLSIVPSASPVNRTHDSWARDRAHDPPTVLCPSLLLPLLYPEELFLTHQLVFLTPLNVWHSLILLNLLNLPQCHIHM
jgi:transposase InsO family protein